MVTKVANWNCKRKFKIEEMKKKSLKFYLPSKNYRLAFISLKKGKIQSYLTA